MYIKIYFLIFSKSTFRLFYIHTGFNDISLIWIVNRKVYDLLFIKLKK